MVHLCLHVLHLCSVLISVTQMCRGAEMQGWSGRLYPNPLLNPYNCSRNGPSYICDPDNVLAEGEADKLDFIITRIRNDTACICPGCNSPDPGITVSVALMKTIEDDFGNSNAKAKDFAVYLRNKWNFGKCDDDVIILVSSVDCQSYATMGPTVLSVLSEELANKIFESSKNHFNNGYYYQGLESIIESYYDVLRQLQYATTHKNKKSPNNKDITIALVVSVATLAALLIFLTILLYRMKRRHRKTTLRTNLTRWHNTKQIKSDDYKICNTDEHSEDCNSEGEPVKDADDASRMSALFASTKRQLSAVIEESENEDDDDTMSEERSRTLSFNQKNNANYIPRIPRFQHGNSQFSAEKDL